MRPRGSLQETGGLPNVFQRLLDRPSVGITLPSMCCYSTQAGIQNLGRCTEFFAFVPRQTRAVHAQLFGERCLRLFAARALDQFALRLRERQCHHVAIIALAVLL